MSGADPGFFLGGGALLSCLTSTPITLIVFFFLQNTSCIRKLQVISGGGGGGAPPSPTPQNGPWVWDVSKVVMYKHNGLTVDIPEGWGVLVQLMVSLLGVLVTLSRIHLMSK